MDEEFKKRILDIIYKGEWSFEGNHIGGGDIEVHSYYLENEDEVVKELVDTIMIEYMVFKVQKELKKYKEKKSFANSNLPSKIFRKLYEILRGEKHPKVSYKKMRGLDQDE